MSWSSFAESELLQPGAAMRATMRSMTATTSGLSNALSMSACILASNASFGFAHDVESPASRAAFSAYAVQPLA